MAQALPAARSNSPIVKEPTLQQVKQMAEEMLPQKSMAQLLETREMNGNGRRSACTSMVGNRRKISIWDDWGGGDLHVCERSPATGSGTGREQRLREGRAGGIGRDSCACAGIAGCFVQLV
uniref:Uncharacterized protein n=1 Tax=Oryza nivara TaxID=4536 RepID=A0A0E0HX87_ORYNI